MTFIRKIIFKLRNPEKKKKKKTHTGMLWLVVFGTFFFLEKYETEKKKRKGMGGLE